jgi:hypothetical protein
MKNKHIDKNFLDTDEDFHLPFTHTDLPKHVVFIVILIGIGAFTIQEWLLDFIGVEIYLHLLFATITAFFLYVIMDNYFIPITQLKDDMHEFPNLNFDLVNNYDEDMDSMNEVLKQIGDQVNSETAHLNESQYIARTLSSLKKIRDILGDEKIKKIEESESNAILQKVIARNEVIKTNTDALTKNTQAFQKQLQETIDILKPLANEELEDTSNTIKLKSSSEVQSIELNADTVWGMSANLTAEINDERVRNNVVKSIRGSYKTENGENGVEALYCYIVPETIKINNNIKTLKRFWKEQGVSNLQISRVQFIKIPQSNWVQAHDIAIYNEGLYSQSIIEFITMQNDTYIYRELDNVDFLISIVKKEMRNHREKFRSKYGNDLNGFFNFESQHFLSFLENDFDELLKNEKEYIVVKDMNGRDIEINSAKKKNWINKCREAQK